MTLYQYELTDEMIEEVRALEGMPLRIEPWNQEASLDGIRHWTWGLGDWNPLYLDEEYAASTPYGGIVAPPTFLFTVYSGSIGLGMAGIQPFGAGSRWEWYELLRRGDRYTVEAKVGPTKVVSGTHASRFVIQTTQSEFRNQDGVLVARCEGRTLRVARSEAEGCLTYEPRKPHEYTAEELEQIRIEAISEPRRGAEPRHWEDVEVGEEIPATVKGPIDLNQMIAYYAGLPGTPRYKSAELQWLYRTWAVESPEKLPNNYDPSYFAESVSPSAGHVDAGVAHQIGMPAAYNNGTQTTGWMAHTVLNWQGDAGFLVELEAKLRRPLIFGDTAWCRGRVTAKREPDLVDLELSVRSQIDETTAEGSAVVRLPRRT